MPLLLFNNNKDKWEEINKEDRENLLPKDKDRTLYLDGYLKEKLDFALKQQQKDNDVVAITVGDEGSGKSSITGNCMRYVTKDNFNPKRQVIGSGYEEGLEKIKKANKKDALMFDEGNVFFLSTETMKKEHRELHKVFSIFRQKNLIVFIVLPSFFRLGSYFALDRSRFLIRTYLRKGERSFFEYYGLKRKEKLYRYGKKTHNYSLVKPNFKGRFTKCKDLESEEYKKFKRKTLMDSFKIAKKKKQKTPKQIQREYRKRIIKNNPNKTQRGLGEILGISESRVGQIQTELEDNEN